MKRTSLICLLTCCFAVALHAQRVCEGVHFEEHKTFREVLQAAKNEGKKICLDFHYDYETCRRLNNELLAEKVAGDFFNKQFI